MGVGKHGAVGITVEGHAQIGCEILCLRRNDFGMQGAAVGVDVAAVGRGVCEVDGSAEMREELGGNGGGGAVGAIEDDAKAVEVQAGKSRAQELLVVFAVVLVDVRGRIRSWNLGVFETPENLLLDAKLGFVG